MIMSDNTMARSDRDTAADLTQTTSTGPSAPLTKSARQAKITALLGRQHVRSQGELGELLAADGVSVTQGTVSRDLVDLGALRVRAENGQLVYAVPGEGGDRTPLVGEQEAFNERLAKLCTEVLISAQASANLVVLRTPPGAAQYFASAIDRADWSSILGTIAGDDTVLLISRDIAGGQQVADRFVEMSGVGHAPANRTRQQPTAVQQDQGAL